MQPAHHFAMATKKVVPEFLEIGTRLELIREAIGIERQTEFAKLCGVQPNAYSQWAKGRAEPLSGTGTSCRKVYVAGLWVA